MKWDEKGGDNTRYMRVRYRCGLERKEEKRGADRKERGGRGRRRVER